jgi:hypothetical protein
MADICYVNPSLPSKQLLRMAQEECIPPDRRVVITDQRVFNYKALIALARQQALEHSRIKQAAAKPAPQPAPQPVTLPKPPDAIGLLFEKLVDAIADSVLAKLKAQALDTKDVAAQEETTRYKQVPPEIQQQQGFGTSWLKRLDEAVRIRKRSVLIIGLNGCQMETMRQYRPDLDYTFINSDDAISRYTVHKDHTILMTKFINHSVQNKYRKHPNLHYCNGGVGDLKTLLQGIFSKETT